uniref:Uncharacterized protein n=1 Tax=Rhizophora mucronata TaxID=61149 RepID=A0A2P2P9J3_RHIMU
MLVESYMQSKAFWYMSLFCFFPFVVIMIYSFWCCC